MNSRLSVGWCGWWVLAGLGLQVVGCGSRVQEPSVPTETVPMQGVSAPTRPAEVPPLLEAPEDGAASGGGPGTEAPPKEDSAPPPAGPGQVHPVLDINPVAVERGSFPDQFVKLGNMLLFTAETPNEGRELWRWDEGAGAHMVVDLVPGTQSSYIEPLTRLGGLVYFVSGIDWSVPAPRLWRTDGTAAGTRELSGLLPAGALSYKHLADVPGRLLILRDSGAQIELWSSDGTSQGSVKLWGASGPRSFPGKMVESRGALFFVSTPSCPDEAEPCQTRPELWRVDASGQRLLLQGAEGGTFSALTPWKDSVVFTVDEATAGSSLWKTDGTVPGTRPVAELGPGAHPMGLIATPERLFFQARQDGHYGVWSTDGTPRGTVWLHGLLETGDWDDERLPTGMTALDGTVYFQVLSPAPSTNTELWRTDGTREGTWRVHAELPWPTQFLAYQGHLYFIDYVYPEGDFDWMRTDGTPGGLERVKRFHSMSYEDKTPAGFTVLDGELFFQASDGQGMELWSSHGSASDTRLVQDLLPALGSSEPERLTAVGARLYFTATDGRRGRELWISEGSAADTRLVREFASGPASTTFRSLLPFGSKLAVSIVEPDNVEVYSTSALWLSNGDASTTWPVRQHMAREYWAGCEQWPAWGFRKCAGYVAVSGNTLYITDSQNGPNPSNWSFTLFSMRDGPPLLPLQTWQQFNPYSLNVSGPSLYFVAARSLDDLVPTLALWHSEGTPESTSRVMDLPGMEGSAWLGTTLYFSAPEPGAPLSQGSVLWRADLASGEAQLVSTGGGSLHIQQELMAVAGGQLFFMSYSGAVWELWVSDGTSAGTRRVKELGGRPMYWAKPLMPLGDRILYWIEDPVRGWGLWRSDGTTMGTTLLKALYPAALHPAPLLLPDGRHVVFQASDGVSGIEPWVSDGTAEGTFLLADVAAGPASSNPDSFAVAGNTLYFAADDQLLGRELWAAPVDAVSTASGALGVEHTVR